MLNVVGLKCNYFLLNPSQGDFVIITCSSGPKLPGSSYCWFVGTSFDRYSKLSCVMRWDLSSFFRVEEHHNSPLILFELYLISFFNFDCLDSCLVGALMPLVISCPIFGTLCAIREKFQHKSLM